MKVVAPPPPLTAPASPSPFGDPSSGYNYFYASAPASPSRAAAFYQEFAFDWEESPARGGSKASFFSDDGFDFSIGFSGQLEGEAPATALATADELFEEGKIRPLNSSSRLSSSCAPIFPRAEEEIMRHERGRSSPSSSTVMGRRGTRSLSPDLRGERGDPNSCTSYSDPATDSSLTKCGGGGGGGSKKWSFKDFFLFRSASEGRATGGGSKDFLRKYTLILTSSSSPKPSSSSFSSFLPSIFGKRRRRGAETRSSAVTKSGPISPRRGGGGHTAAAAAHGMHYTSMKGAAEEMKKKTPLAYQNNSLFDCLRFNPAIQGLSREFAGASSSRSSITSLDRLFCSDCSYAWLDRTGFGFIASLIF